MILAAALALAACWTEPERAACGSDPALIVWAWGSERAREGEYLQILEALDTDSSLASWFRWYAQRFPQDGLTYFHPGERVDLLRGGDLSDRTVLVRRHGERLWSTWREFRC
jgi:hypothetical protein